MLHAIKFCHYLVPDPVSVIVTSDLDSPIRPIGSDVTLTCTVKLSPAVDVPVTVNTVWTGPAKFMTSNTEQPSMSNTTTYITRTTIGSFIRGKSRHYICRATVISKSPFITSSSLSGVKRITTGKMYSLTHQCIHQLLLTLCRCLSLFQWNLY